MSLLNMRSKVCIAPFHMRSKVCIAPIHVRRKFTDFAPHMNGSNADFAPHMEGSHADFAPNIERRNSFWDQIIAQIAIYVNFFKNLWNALFLEVYITYVTTFETKNILRESTFNINLSFHNFTNGFCQIKLDLNLKSSFLPIDFGHKGQYRVLAQTYSFKWLYQSKLL